MNASMCLGKATESLVTARLLKSLREVYTPVVDDHGVDVIVPGLSGNSYQEIQIKSIATGGLFAAINCPNPRPNYWFVFYVWDIETMWLINSMDLTNPNLKLSSKNVNGRNVGKYSISLANKKGPVAKCAQYIITDFNKLP